MVKSYEDAQRYVCERLKVDTIEQALAFAGVESEAERNRIINTPEALIDFAEEIRKAAEKWK